MQRRVIAAGLLLAWACTHDTAGPSAVFTHAGGDAPVVVSLEVADDPVARQQGLMWRESLADGHGMLFVFDEDDDHTFWMKNTLIPLDMVFIARDGPTTGHVVGIRTDTKPHSLAPIGVGAASRWVLEVPAGFAARRGLRAGDRVELRQVRAR